MKMPGESNASHEPQRSPSATEAELDGLIIDAGRLFTDAFERLRSGLEFEPDEYPMPGVVGVTATRDELETYPTLQRWSKGEIQYTPRQIVEVFEDGNTSDVLRPPTLAVTFTSDTEADAFRMITLTPSFIEGEPISKDERSAIPHDIEMEKVPRAEVTDIAKLLGAIVKPDRLEFPAVSEKD